ncbi:hypothetical protein BP5796_05667 [Coleophoma crateriformis]|uniref:Uncharacterized protein n=1 Tax=Coleophoma crateriformis TaxID=565419 RepID=A0A3D8S3V2_9HELO|nr:hypothetical protein BP5796_05667 [Coleophoma crateriformis]
MRPQDRRARRASCSQLASDEGSLDLSDAQIPRPRYPFEAKEAPMLAEVQRGSVREPFTRVSELTAVLERKGKTPPILLGLTTGFEKEFIAAIAHISAFLQDVVINEDLISSVDAGPETIDEPETGVVVSAISGLESDSQPVHAGKIVAATRTPISSYDALSDGSSACESGSQSESESETENTASCPSSFSSTPASRSWSVVARAAHEIAGEAAAAAKARLDVPGRGVTLKKAIKKECDEPKDLDTIYGPFPDEELERPRRFVKWRDITEAWR